MLKVAPKNIIAALRSYLSYVSVYLVLELAFRVFLSIKEQQISLLPAILLRGAFFDIISFGYIVVLINALRLICFALLNAANFLLGKKVSNVISLIKKKAGNAEFCIFVFVVTFNIFMQHFFWQEFSDKYNFLAVDYLLYTDEVAGNIKESYNLWSVLLLSAFIATLSLFFVKKIAKATLVICAKNSIIGFVFFLLICTTSFFLVEESSFSVSKKAQSSFKADKISQNSLYSLFSAFRANEIEYSNFYPQLQQSAAVKTINSIYGTNVTNQNDPLGNSIVNRSQGGKKRYNIIVVAMESMGADFVALKDENGQSLTPNLNSIALESLYFPNTYSTGTRTVRGIEALTLSIPPTPGTSIVRRLENENLYSLGHVLHVNNYKDRLFVYGGYGYFDNMNKFFSGNHFGILDKKSFSSSDVTFQNAWGACDEDLFNKTIESADKSYKEGNTFGYFLLTSSNHRPFTYPSGKIDIPSGKSRAGGVKYADYAIGEFVKKSKTKPWFKDTIFVIVADHPAGVSGKNEVDYTKYKIPMMFYAPHIIKAKHVDLDVSQIDMLPTLIDIAKLNYYNVFYGKSLVQKDSFAEKNNKGLLVATFQLLGHYKNDETIILKPNSQIEVINNKTNSSTLLDKKNRQQSEEKLPSQIRRHIEEVQAIYQHSSNWRKNYKVAK